MKYFYVEPEVASGLGERTVMDHSVQALDFSHELGKVVYCPRRNRKRFPINQPSIVGGRSDTPMSAINCCIPVDAK